MPSTVEVIAASKINLDNGVKELYCTKFGKMPEWIIKCPGRVNLIGEHIDHNGYSVLPMAIQVNTCVAIGKSNDKLLHFENSNPTKYLSNTCDVEESITSLKCIGFMNWHHYCIAGWRGAIESIFSITKRPFNNDLIENMKGLNIAVSGNIPPNAGLSSSSALVCASTLATFAIQTCANTLKTIEKRDLVEIITKAERFVGVEGGGMDQACECLAEANFALRIDFNPLNFERVKLPSNAMFAVVHSGTEMNKAATSYYNQRVVECRLAAQIICKKASLLVLDSLEIMTNVRTLKHAAIFFQLEAEDPSRMLDFVAKYLKPADQPYSRVEILDILNVTDETLAEISLNNNTQNMQKFWLTKRALHVYSEASRVLAFEKVCRAEFNAKNNDVLKLARLMNESHVSCRDQFECSCPELDIAVEKCRAAGCIGARLTGAGWGGCVVALVNQSDYEKINAKADELNILFWSESVDGIKAFCV